MNKDYKVGDIISIDVEKLWNSLKELETDEIFVDTCSKELLYTTIRSSDDDFYIEGEQSVYACCDGETCELPPPFRVAASCFRFIGSICIIN